MKVLVVEDDPAIANGLVSYLSRTEFCVEHVDTVADAKHAIASGIFELVVLDLNLPDGDGLRLLSKLRSQGEAVPVLILTARDQTRERVQGLETGADDYLAKPFDMQELLARLRAIQRRSAGRASNRIDYGPLTLFPERKHAKFEDMPVDLPAKQYKLLQYLVEAQGRIVTKQQAIDALYSWDDGVAENTIEVYVSQLRAALWPEVIKTVRGVGYCAP